MNPQIFDDAADYILRNGWWNGVDLDSESKMACINTAVYLSAKKGDLPEALNVLLAHFNLQELGDLWALNDSQPTNADGTGWAVGNLRVIAQKLREGWWRGIEDG